MQPTSKATQPITITSATTEVRLTAVQVLGQTKNAANDAARKSIKVIGATQLVGKWDDIVQDEEIHVAESHRPSGEGCRSKATK